MLSRSFFLLTSSILFFFCGNSFEDTKENLQNHGIDQDSFPSNIVQDTIRKKDKRSECFYAKVTRESTIEVLSIEKVIDTVSKFFKVYKDRCESWKLDKQNIINIVKFSKEISGQDVHHFYDVLPCYYSGEININGKLVPYEINAGAVTVLFFKDTSIYLGYEKDDYKKYFLIGPGIE